MKPDYILDHFGNFLKEHQEKWPWQLELCIPNPRLGALCPAAGKGYCSTNCNQVTVLINIPELWPEREGFLCENSIILLETTQCSSSKGSYYHNNSRKRKSLSSLSVPAEFPPCSLSFDSQSWFPTAGQAVASHTWEKSPRRATGLLSFKSLTHKTENKPCEMFSTTIWRGLRPLLNLPASITPPLPEPTGCLGLCICTRSSREVRWPFYIRQFPNTEQHS